ncbi:hypothetical protein G6011_02813 [Alternaria panax]|uniref:2EXR domain-containing protein n=1 Tax=Alternaria panax TaxID=48097 RepID=A0AAD4FAL6_9PLEO|nr:hypothetical protein G6011_02813 [Alternaria panax]
MSTFTPFSRLPMELRDLVWQASKPTTATVEFDEDEFMVTSISPPSALLTTSKEARATALSFSLQKFPIWGPEDWEDLAIDSENTILEIVIRPSKSASLNITWTDIWGALGDALPATSRLHIVCNKPERLARLYMAEEAEYLGVGQSCVEGGLFNNAETVSGERKTRESLHPHLTVTASKHIVEEIDHNASKKEVTVWKIATQDISDDFGPEAKIPTTRNLARVEVDNTPYMSVEQLHNAARAFVLPVREEVERRVSGGEEVEVVKSGVELTEDAVTKHLEECARLWAPKPKDPNWDPEGSVAAEENDAVRKWLE